MSELVVTLLRLSYLILLWVLVLFAIGVLRRDVFGTRILRRGAPAKPPPATPAPARPAPAAKPAVVGKPGPPPRSSTGVPSAAAAAAAPPGRSGRLLITDGALRGKTMQLGTAAVVIGRAPTSSLVVEDDFASSRHARIFPQHGGWWVEDLGSTNGTFVDGKRISEPVELTPGRQVRIGQTVIELQR